MPDTRTKDFEVTQEGTILEAQEIIDLKGPFAPVKTRLVEWIDERHYRDVVVAAALPAAALFFSEHP
jgi:hypothetical protein